MNTNTSFAPNDPLSLIPVPRSLSDGEALIASLDVAIQNERLDYCRSLCMVAVLPSAFSPRCVCVPWSSLFSR